MPPNIVHEDRWSTAKRRAPQLSDTCTKGAATGSRRSSLDLGKFKDSALPSPLFVLIVYNTLNCCRWFSRSIIPCSLNMLSLSCFPTFVFSLPSLFYACIFYDVWMISITTDNCLLYDIHEYITYRLAHIGILTNALNLHVCGVFETSGLRSWPWTLEIWDSYKRLWRRSGLWDPQGWLLAGHGLTMT